MPRRVSQDPAQCPLTRTQGAFLAAWITMRLPLRCFVLSQCLPPIAWPVAGIGLGAAGAAAPTAPAICRVVSPTALVPPSCGPGSQGAVSMYFLPSAVPSSPPGSVQWPFDFIFTVSCLPAGFHYLWYNWARAPILDLNMRCPRSRLLVWICCQFCAETKHCTPSGKLRSPGPVASALSSVLSPQSRGFLIMPAIGQCVVPTRVLSVKLWHREPRAVGCVSVVRRLCAACCRCACRVHLGAVGCMAVATMISHYANDLTFRGGLWYAPRRCSSTSTKTTNGFQYRKMLQPPSAWHRLTHIRWPRPRGSRSLYEYL